MRYMIMRSNMEKVRSNYLIMSKFFTTRNYVYYIIFWLIVELMQNITIEERVALLEIQVTDLEQNVADLNEDVNFLFDETVLQDERILTLEQDNDVINEDLDGQY